MTSFFRAVKPMSMKQIESVTDRLRSVLTLPADARVQMINLVEWVLEEALPEYRFRVLPDEDMPGMDGWSAIGKTEICLSNSTYESLAASDPAARQVVAHELGHMVMHAFQNPQLAKRSHSDRTVDPEWQADRFADCWLMPRAGVLQCKNPAEVADRYTVTLEAAERRFDEVNKIQGELFE